MSPQTAPPYPLSTKSEHTRCLERPERPRHLGLRTEHAPATWTHPWVGFLLMLTSSSICGASRWRLAHSHTRSPP
eukprot:2104741-Prymnesium_polylepis.1